MKWVFNCNISPDVLESVKVKSDLTEAPSQRGEMFFFGMMYHIQYWDAKLFCLGKYSSETFYTHPTSHVRNTKCHLFFLPPQCIADAMECWPLNQNIRLACPVEKKPTLSKVVYKCLKTISKGLMLKALVVRLQNSGRKQPVLFQVAEDNRDFLNWGRACMGPCEMSVCGSDWCQVQKISF